MMINSDLERIKKQLYDGLSVGEVIVVRQKIFGTSYQLTVPASKLEELDLMKKTFGASVDIAEPKMAICNMLNNSRRLCRKVELLVTAKNCDKFEGFLSCLNNLRGNGRF